MGFSIVRAANGNAHGSKPMQGIRVASYTHRTGFLTKVSIGADVQSKFGFKTGDKVDVLIGDGPDAGRLAMQPGGSYTLNSVKKNGGPAAYIHSLPLGRTIGHTHKSSECQIIESECAQGRIVFSLPPKVFARMSADTASVAAVA